mgnify:CR=1 FL=1
MSNFVINPYSFASGGETYIQSNSGSTTGTYNNKIYFGCDLTDADWYDRGVTSIKFTLARTYAGTFNGDVECYHIASNGTSETLVDTETIVVTNTAAVYTWTFDITLSASGGYIMLKGLPQGDANEEIKMYYDTTPDPADSDTVEISTKVDAAASPSTRAGEYPTTEIEYTE